ncbi:MAG: hypothetical protein EA376_03735 [Phycisphaeraceae bacterium]|nr:MAG: hypothetical protein EA376_03735 [Phycisphaeraceae bacterium]
MSRIEKLKSLLETTPDDAELHYMLAQEHAKEGDHLAAAEWYDRCLARAPEHCYAYFHKARSLEALGDLAAARATLKEGLEKARTAGDSKAEGEIEGYLDTLPGGG